MAKSLQFPSDCLMLYKDSLCAFLIAQFTQKNTFTFQFAIMQNKIVGIVALKKYFYKINHVWDILGKFFFFLKAL